MAIVFTNAKVFLGGVELTAQFNQIALDWSAESLDATAFGDTTRIKRGGLEVAAAQGRGFYQSCEPGAGLPDPALFDGVGLADEVLTIFPDSIVEGSTSTGAGFAFKVMQSQFNLSGAVGEILPFDFAAEGRGVQA